MAQIIVEKGPERGRAVEIKAGARLVFGRDETCDIVTSDIACSRRHFGVAEKEGRFIIKDLNSSHGTTLNGKPVDQQELTEGDTIVAGETVLSFTLENASNRGLIGKTIAGYQIIERLGRGGMGTVYRAKQVALDRDVALKVLSARYSQDKVFINRFFKEAQAAARLNNPNVVQVYDVREEKGLYLISLEMMSNGTVQDLATKEGQLEIKRILEIARDASKGLVYAEKKGIVHGDIKPDNLMMNADTHVKISDLGLARDAGDVAHQGEEGIFGTPHFISPEQAQGKHVDTRSDIYSLGATLYRLISGSTPFTGNSVREIVMKQIQEEPADLRSLRSDCPQDLADLVSVMMAKDREDRFASAETLLEAIEALGDSGKLASAGSGLTKIAAVIVALIVIGGAGWWFNRDKAGPPVTPNNGGVVKPKGPTPEELALQASIQRKELELEVEGLVLAAERTRTELERDDRFKILEELEGLRAMYAAAVERGPDTEAATKAKAKIAEIDTVIAVRRDEMAVAEAARQARREAANSVFEGVQEAVKPFMAEGHYGAALQEVDRRVSDLVDTHREADLVTLREDIVKATTEAADAATKSARGNLKDESFAKAREAVTAFRDALIAQTEDAPALEEIAPFDTAAQALRAEIDSLEAAARERDRKLDQETVFSSLHRYYSDFGKSFQPERAQRLLGDTKKQLQTGHFTARLDEMEQRLARVFSLREALQAAVTDPKVEVVTSAGAREIPAGQVVEVTDKDFTVERRSGTKEKIEFGAVSADLLYAKFFRRISFAPRARMDLAWWLLESGLYEEAVEIVDELKEDPSAVDGPELESLNLQVREELAAKSLLDEARAAFKKADKGGDNSAWFRVDRILSILLDKYRHSRVFLIHSDGGAGLD